MTRWIEFFEAGDKGLLGIRNLTIFITIVVSSGVVIYLTYIDELSAEIFASYLLAGGGVYSFGKWQDDKTTRSRIDLNAEPDVNTTTINKAEAVNVTGDVKLKKRRK